MGQAIVLVVDDDDAIRLACIAALKTQGYTLLSASNGETAKSLLDKFSIDLVLTDYQMGEISGLDVLKYAKSTHPECEVVVMTAFPSQNLAVDVLRNLKGAFFLSKPLEVARLREVVKHCLEKKNTKKMFEDTKITINPAT